MKRLTSVAALVLCGALPACGTAPPDPGVPTGAETVGTTALPERRVYMPAAKSTEPSDLGSVSSPLISQTHAAKVAYHGGSVISGQLNIYYIYYGTWTRGARTDMLENFAANVGEKRWWNINTLYSGVNGVTAATVTFGGSTIDNFSQGRPATPGATVTLSNGQVDAIIQRAINTTHALPLDTYGVYMVLGSAEVSQRSTGLADLSLCTDFCAWHYSSLVSGSHVAMGFAADISARCPNNCYVQNPSPNSDPGGDALVNVIAHEVAEAAVDPQLEFDRDGWIVKPPLSAVETADICTGIYGSTRSVGNGAQVNQHIGSYDYRLQQNWVPTGAGFCASGWESKNDIIWRNVNTNDIGVWQMNPDLSIQFGPVLRPASNLGFIGSGDFDGDGNYDYLFRDGSDRISTWRMSGTERLSTATLDIGKGLPHIADFDGDGRSDVAFFDFNTLVYTIWYMNSPSQIRGKEPHLLPSADVIPSVADFDGDGRADVMYFSGTGTILDSTSLGRVTAPAITADYDIGHLSLTGQFRGDGREQVLMRRLSDDVIVIYGVFPSTPPRLVHYATVQNVGVGFPWMMMGVSDVDGNGRDDILWHNQSGGELSYWLSNQPNGLFSFSPIFGYIPPSSGWMIVGTGSDHAYFK